MNEYPSLETATSGSFRFNTDSSKLEIYNGDQWWEIDSTSPEFQTGATRGLFCGGEAPSKVNVIQFINVDTTGDAIDFGDANNTLTAHTAFSSRTRGLIANGFVGPQPTQYLNVIDFVTIASQGNASDFGDATVGIGQRSSCSSSTRGLIISGVYAGIQQNIIEYVTMAQTGNAIDFGDLTQKVNGNHSLSSPTRGVTAGGYYASPLSAIANIMSYVTISTLGNGADFGDLTRTTRYPSTSANAVRGIFAGGANPSRQDTIDFITIASLGDSKDFGNLSTSISDFHQGAASPTRGVFAGGSDGSLRDEIEYVQIMTTGNSADFGDLLAANQYCAGISNGHGGLG